MRKFVLTYEELHRENVIYSSHFTYFSDDLGDFAPLIPAMFQSDRSNLNVTDMYIIDANCIRNIIRLRTKVVEHLRSRYRKEYLWTSFKNSRKVASQIMFMKVISNG